MKKVLIFEIDPAFARALREDFRRLGCSVRLVDDGSVGLQAAAVERPDLILLAIELPRMNGFSVCNKLKRDPQLMSVPLVMLSSEATEEVFEQHRRQKTRADVYLRKPIAFRDLLAHIRSIIPGFGDVEDELTALDEAEVMDDMVLEEDAVSSKMQPSAGGLDPDDIDTYDGDRGAGSAADAVEAEPDPGGAEMSDDSDATPQAPELALLEASNNDSKRRRGEGDKGAWSKSQGYDPPRRMLQDEADDERTVIRSGVTPLSRSPQKPATRTPEPSLAPAPPPTSALTMAATLPLPALSTLPAVAPLPLPSLAAASVPVPLRPPAAAPSHSFALPPPQAPARPGAGLPPPMSPGAGMGVPPPPVTLQSPVAAPPPYGLPTGSSAMQAPGGGSTALPPLRAPVAAARPTPAPMPAISQGRPFQASATPHVAPTLPAPACLPALAPLPSFSRPGPVPTIPMPAPTPSTQLIPPPPSASANTSASAHFSASPTSTSPASASPLPPPGNAKPMFSLAKPAGATAPSESPTVVPTQDSRIAPSTAFFIPSVAVSSALASTLKPDREMLDLREALNKKEGESLALREQLSRLAAELAACVEERDRLRAEAAEMTADRASERARIEKARARWEEDRGSLERARQALTAALSQIQEAEQRSLE